MKTLKKIKRVLDFLPIIWRGNDWDYYYTIELFQFQIKRLEGSIRNGEHEKASHYADRAKLAVELLDRFNNDYYIDVYMQNFQHDDKFLHESIKQQDKCDALTWRFIAHNIRNWWS